MKKTLSTVVLSAILLGAISPTSTIIADGVISQNSSVVPYAQNVSHVDPTIDWTNWQDRGTGGAVVSGPNPILTLSPYDGTVTRTFSVDVTPSYGAVTGGDTVASIGFQVPTKDNSLVFRINNYGEPYAQLSSNVTVTNNSSGKQWTCPTQVTQIFGSPYQNDYIIDTSDIIVNTGDSLTISGSVIAKDTGVAKILILVPKCMAMKLQLE